MGGEPLADLLPPLTVPIEEFVKNDRAVQARAMAHLVAMMEQPITRRQPRSGVVQIEPNLAKIRVEIAKHLTGLVPDPASDAADPAPTEGARGETGSGPGSNGLRLTG